MFFLFRYFALSLFRSPLMFVEYYTQGLEIPGVFYNSPCFENRLVLPSHRSDWKKKSDQASRPISIGPLNGLLQLHAQPINQVVFLGS